MADSTDYVDFILDQLSNWKTIITKRMFGCVGLYADGLMFGIIAKETIYFKVDDSNKNKYLEAGSETLKLFKSNSVVASFYEVPVEIIEDANQFVVWAEASLEIQKRKNEV
ncbi:TfoX/Sxy family protein [Maribacter sp. ANRC-HE7]|uniref:TfoX/Sxy family protein n=1 Tax=Maribacter aquimaris TaxID=2737171 RepID=A0ABR7UVP8_9FLAO|nr:TfoX/Sxy family protein [Maribacter aquimaris]MBD0776413.1 TfoX/Sxy family protein [Maribacter aquimaris]